MRALPGGQLGKILAIISADNKSNSKPATFDLLSITFRRHRQNHTLKSG